MPVARLRYPNSAVPPALSAHVLQMGQIAERIVAKTGSVIASKDTGTALSLEQDDDAMDDLHRRLFDAILHDTSELPRETLVDLTLLGRYYERFADHGVSVAQRVVYLVTGEYGSEPDETGSRPRARPRGAGGLTGHAVSGRQ
jgi:phosphate transport system protein